MFLMGDQVVWSASDLAAASECEFRVARRLDVKLRRIAAADEPSDPLQERIAQLGDVHEARLLDRYAAAGAVARVERLTGAHSEERLRELAAVSLARFDQGVVVYQPGFFDGEFFGYADFVEPSEQGWVVADAKLARSAKPKAMLQVAAYADQLDRAGLPVAPYGALLLGDGRREAVPLRDILPAFRARRERLRQIVAERLEASDALDWEADTHTICGYCPECTGSITEHHDLLLVAGLRRDQRRKLRESGIRTLQELAEAQACPDELSQATFARLRTQARAQAEPPDADGRPVFHPVELGPRDLPVTLPPRSDGDIFFDFEGDPLYSEDDPAHAGLEYLWGLRLAVAQPGHETFEPLWAHSYAEEREALTRFMRIVAERSARHPELHIYHYAPYEVTALKRLAGKYGLFEAELDDLLRRQVFVDLYAVVRRAVVVSQPSYSIKKLEPLYMRHELRVGDVQKGDVSIAEYHLFRQDREAGDEEAAATRLKELEDYNAYDCLSTQRLRDWLIDTVHVPVETARPTDEEDDEPLSDAALDRARLVDELRARADATADPAGSHAWRLLAAAVGYHRREDLPFWWDHFHRLKTEVNEWSGDRDVFVVERAEVVVPWAVSGRQRKPRRTVRLVGAWSPGSSTPKNAYATYALPGPSGSEAHDHYAWATGGLTVSTPDPDEPDVIEVTEQCAAGADFDDLPIALTPTCVRADVIEGAIQRYATEALAADTEPSNAAWDLLLRRPPRLRRGALPALGNDAVATVTAAVTALDRSYLAVQGPPGSGKSWSAAQVIRELVQTHGWRIGVVAQSHAVVEHLLDGIVEHGLDPALVGKSDPRNPRSTWTVVANTGPKRSAWVDAHRAEGRGCVLGGTAWTFSAAGLRDQFDLVVVDEAGQFSLANTVAVSTAAHNLLLLGDPQQLPQVSQGQHPEPVDGSALGWLMGDEHTLPAAHGYFLPTSFRMCEHVCTPVSALSYDGRLASSAPERYLAGVEPGLHTLAVPHTANRTSSPEEAEAVADRFEQLLGTSWTEDGTTRPIGERDILVVAPYNAQVALIRSVLAGRGHREARVGTVDKFQGQQAPVTIVSLAVSSPREAPRGMDFLLNRNRLNVAVSRAKWCAVIVYSPHLTHYMPTTVAGLQELGGFLGLVEASHAARLPVAVLSPSARR